MHVALQDATREDVEQVGNVADKLAWQGLDILPVLCRFATGDSTETISALFPSVKALKNRLQNLKTADAVVVQQSQRATAQEVSQTITYFISKSVTCKSVCAPVGFSFDTIGLCRK